MNENLHFEKGEYYFIRFVDHNLKLNYEKEISDVIYSMIGRYISDNVYYHHFYILECSDEGSSDIFSIVKGTIIRCQKVEVNHK